MTTSQNEHIFLLKETYKDQGYKSLNSLITCYITSSGTEKKLGAIRCQVYRGKTEVISKLYLHMLERCDLKKLIYGFVEGFIHLLNSIKDSCKGLFDILISVLVIFLCVLFFKIFDAFTSKENPTPKHERILSLIKSKNHTIKSFAEIFYDHKYDDGENFKEIPKNFIANIRSHLRKDRPLKNQERLAEYLEFAEEMAAIY